MLFSNNINSILACTQWFNSDDCSRDGDRETISEGIGLSESVVSCPNSYRIEAKFNEDIMYNSDNVLAVTGNRVLFNYQYPPNSLAGVGLICDNKNYTQDNNGPRQQCKDYSVRFCCPGKFAGKCKAATDTDIIRKII